MQSSRPDIKVIALFMQTKTNIKINGNADASREKHDQRLDRLWVLEALYCLPKNDKGDDDEGDSVDKCSKNAKTMIAKGFAFIGWSLCLYCGKPGKAQCKDIGNDVTSIREQGQRICEKAAKQLSRKNQHSQEKG